MSSVLAILASARGDGYTAALLDAVLAGRDATRLDLTTLEIHDYEYGRVVEDDDFASLADAMLKHPVIVLATPVY